jgi:hypothetical protein
VWLRRSLAAVAVAVLLAGCGGGGGSDSEGYSATEVAEALQARGFNVEVLSKSAVDFLKTFPDQTPKGVIGVVSERGTAGAVPDPTAFVITAWIFGSAAEATCPAPNPFTTCLKEGNVAVLVRKDGAGPARGALDDLG